MIATYNWSSVLRWSLRSALRQDYPRLEVIVVGDGCDDDFEQVVRSFGDARVRWHNLARNSGSQSAPNNAGIELARGEYVAYLGHDDLWLPTHLSWLVGALARSGAGLAHSLAEMIGPPPRPLRLVTGTDPAAAAAGVLPPSSILHRRELAHEVGGWRDYRELVLPPDQGFVAALHRRTKVASVAALTVFKFNSAWRPGSYVEKPSHEQAAYSRRIDSERGFVLREIAAVAAARAAGRMPELPAAPDPVPPGWYVSRWRKIRGLE